MYVKALIEGKTLKKIIKSQLKSFKVKAANLHKWEAGTKKGFCMKNHCYQNYF